MPRFLEHDTPENFTIESWNAHLNINLRAPALLMRDFANQPHWQPHWGKKEKKNAQDGCIIQPHRPARDAAHPRFFKLHCVKICPAWANHSFAQALADKHIRVNAIAPGPTLPNPRQSQAAFDKQAGLVPLQHGASLDDIARAVRYLLSAQA